MGWGLGSLASVDEMRNTEHGNNNCNHSLSKIH